MTSKSCRENFDSNVTWIFELSSTPTIITCHWQHDVVYSRREWFSIGFYFLETPSSKPWFLHTFGKYQGFDWGFQIFRYFFVLASFRFLHSTLGAFLMPLLNRANEFLVPHDCGDTLRFACFIHHSEQVSLTQRIFAACSHSFRRQRSNHHEPSGNHLLWSLGYWSLPCLIIHFITSFNWDDVSCFPRNSRIFIFDDDVWAAASLHLIHMPLKFHRTQMLIWHHSDLQSGKQGLESDITKTKQATVSYCICSLIRSSLDKPLWFNPDCEPSSYTYSS